MHAPEVSPRWFTIVMGTAIVATSASVLPRASDHLDALALAMWALAATALCVTTSLAAWHYMQRPGALRRHLRDSAVAPFFGAAAMAPMALGVATLVVGRGALGEHVAVAASLTLWLCGSALGLTVAIAVPRLMARGAGGDADPGAPTRLLPVVSPIVSAAGGALLVPHLAPMPARALALACLTMLVASFAAAVVVITRVVARLTVGSLPQGAAVTGLWLVLGPLGQSATAAGLLADSGVNDVGVPTAPATAASIAFGSAVLLLALGWLAFCLGVTIRAALRGLAFTLGWWAFTFPVGTCATAASVLARHTAFAPLEGLAIALFCLLIAGWSAAAYGTARAYAPRFARLRFRLATQPGPS